MLRFLLLALVSHAQSQSQCSDSDNGATDSYGDGCTEYTGNLAWCGNYDDADFSSNTMCCACGGGTNKPPSLPPPSSPPSAPPPAPPSAPPSAPASNADPVTIGLAVLCAVCGLFGAALVVMLLMDKCKQKPASEETGGRVGAQSVGQTAGVDPNQAALGKINSKPDAADNGWGPLGFLFPQEWAKVWIGYWLMLVFTCFIFPLILPAIMPSGGGMAMGEAVETLIALGPFLHCVLMPFFWYRTHRRTKNKLPEEAYNTPRIDPDAKTIVFSAKMALCDKIVVLIVSIIFGIIAKVLWLLKTVTGGTLNLEGFWFPAPFFQFWQSKLFLRGLQIDGCKIRTKATQDDAYMRFCTHAMLNFWTCGFYSKCCAKKANYERWLDRSLEWVGKPPVDPKGTRYNNQFRIFDKKMTLCQKIRVFFVSLLLTLCGGFLSFLPLVGGFWPASQLLQVYLYKVQLSNMKFGGADPYFGPEFTYCNYIVKFYTIGMCGLCGGALKRWVDAQIILGEAKFDQEMANEDKEDIEMHETPQEKVSV